jgi:hypothetical protein
VCCAVVHKLGQCTLDYGVPGTHVQMFVGVNDCVQHEGFSTIHAPNAHCMLLNLGSGSRNKASEQTGECLLCCRA